MPRDLMPRMLATFHVELGRVLDLREPDSVATLGITKDGLFARDPRPGQSIGEAAHYVGFEGILVPSAARPDGVTLPIFIGRLAAQSRIELTATTHWDNVPNDV